MLFLSLGSLILSIPVVQTQIARYATATLNKTFDTRITIDRVKLSLFTLNTDIQGIYIEDYKKDTLVYVRRLNTSLLNLKNATGGDLAFGAMALEGVFFNLKTYQGEEDSNLDVFVAKLDDGKPRPPGTPPFRMVSEAISITEGRFALTNENLKRPQVLNFTNLALQAEAFQILGPEVSLHLKTLALNTQRGLTVQQLATHFTYTPQQMRFAALQLNTAESNIAGNLVMHYKREDLKDFTDRVTLEADFTTSTIALNDLNAFYNAFGADKKMVFSGKARGTLNRLRLHDLKINSEQTAVHGSFVLKRLFETNAPFDIHADLRSLTSSYTQLRSLLPRILGKDLPPVLQRLGTFTLKGQADVTATSLEAHIDLNTSVGKGYTNLRITKLQAIDNASYYGSLLLTDFDLGAFAGSDRLGLTSLEVEVAGKGFNAAYLNTEVNGVVSQIDYNGYTYKNLNIAGVFKDQFFEGVLESKDENCSFTFKGLADFSERKNSFNFTASVAHADLKELRFTNDSIALFKGDITMNIQGTTLDDMVGFARFSNTAYQNKYQTYTFEDFAIASAFDVNRVRTVNFNSPDVITGYLKGKFTIKEIGKLFQNAIGSLYARYEPYEITPGQYLNFNLRIYNKIVAVFFPRINFGPNTAIQGSVNTDTDDFKLDFTAPEIAAFGHTLSAVELKVDNKNPLFNTFISIDALANDTYNLKDFSLINTSLKDTLFFRTEFKGGKDYQDRYNLNFYHTFTQDDTFVMGFKKSDLTFKGNTWQLNKDNNTRNKVTFNRTLDSIAIAAMVLDHKSKAQIKLQGQLADSTYKNIDLKLNKVALSKIAPNLDSLKIDGVANGFVNIRQKEGKYSPTANVNIKDLNVNRTRLGDLAVNLLGNDDLTQFSVNTWLSDNGKEKLSLNGNITNRDDTPQLNLLANITDFPLAPFSPLGKDVISNIRGIVNGNAEISGTLSNPTIEGMLTLQKAGLGIPYLNVDYDFAPYAKVRLSGQTFYVDDIQLSDVAEGTTATLGGTISHNKFQDWILDLKVDTRNRRFIVLNTPYGEEVLYYGQAFINGTGHIYGPTDALTIKVEATTAEGTTLKIPLRDITTVGDYSFINFIEKGTPIALEEERVLKEYQGLEMAFDLTVTPDAEVEIVVDQNTGSALKGTGEGILLIEINTNGKFNMYGDFVVVTGAYNLKYGGIIDKKFKVRPGGRIVWDRDPLEAQLDLEAVYALNANPAPLLDNPGFTGSILTEVVIRLDGALESPNIYFDIDFPRTSSVVQSELEYRLQDPTLKERNAFSLLAQGGFWSPQSTLDGGQIALGNAVQTASGLLNQILEGDNDKFNFGVSYEQGVLDPNTDIRTEDRIGVTVSTQLSEKVLVNGRVGVPVGGVSETVVAGDVEIQILLNETGSLSAVIFNRENQIQQFLGEQQGYIQGAGLSYRVDFNNFRELLRKILGKQKTSY